MITSHLRCLKDNADNWLRAFLHLNILLFFINFDGNFNIDFNEIISPEIQEEL